MVAASLLLAAMWPALGSGAQQSVATCLRLASASDGCVPELLEVDFSAGVSPPRLPRHELAPVALTLRGAVGLRSGGHPSALREASIVIAEGVKIDTEGLVACPQKRLMRLDAAGAQRACGKAIVGNGTAHLGFASSESVVRAPFTLFNGGTSNGVTRLFVQGVVDTPEPTTLVGVAKVVRRHGGLEADLWLPPILEGDGSLLDFRLQIGRRFVRRGVRHSYLKASCRREVIKVQVPRLVFRNEAHAPGVPAETVLKGGLAVPC